MFANMALATGLVAPAGNDKKLFDLLTKKKDYTEHEAGDILQLLHWFSPEQVANPETWNALISYPKYPKISALATGLLAPGRSGHAHQPLHSLQCCRQERRACKRLSGMEEANPDREIAASSQRTWRRARFRRTTRSRRTTFWRWADGTRWDRAVGRSGSATSCGTVNAEQMIDLGELVGVNATGNSHTHEYCHNPGGTTAGVNPAARKLTSSSLPLLLRHALGHVVHFFLPGRFGWLKARLLRYQQAHQRPNQARIQPGLAALASATRNKEPFRNQRLLACARCSVTSARAYKRGSP